MRSLPRLLLIGIAGVDACRARSRASAPTTRFCRNRWNCMHQGQALSRPASSTRPKTSRTVARRRSAQPLGVHRDRPGRGKATSVRQGDPDDQQGAAARAQRSRRDRRPGRSDGRIRRGARAQENLQKLQTSVRRSCPQVAQLSTRRSAAGRRSRRRRRRTAPRPTKHERVRQRDQFLRR